MIFPLMLFGMVDYNGNIHIKNITSLDSVVTKVWSSNSSQSTEYDTTDQWGGWGVSLLYTDVGDTVYAEFRREKNGVVYIGKLKDIGDGYGYMPDNWLYDSLKVAQNPDSVIRTFAIWQVIDTSGVGSCDTVRYGSNKWPIDTTLLITAYIWHKGWIKDTMVVDTSGWGEKFKGKTLRFQPHYFDVYLPVRRLQDGDTLKIIMWKIIRDTIYEKILDSLVYNKEKYGDALVLEDLTPSWVNGEQYDTLFFPDTIYPLTTTALNLESFKIMQRKILDKILLDLFIKTGMNGELHIYRKIINQDDKPKEIRQIHATEGTNIITDTLESRLIQRPTKAIYIATMGQDSLTQSIIINPTNGKPIHIPSIVNGDFKINGPEEYKVKIFGVDGRLIEEKETNTKIKLEEPGAYIIRIEDEKGKDISKKKIIYIK